MAALASPYVERRAPITASRNSPVIYICNPIAEASLAYIRRIPFNRIIVCNELILKLCHLNIPARLCIIKQRRAASPAMRIVMHYLLFLKQLTVFIQPFYNVRVRVHYEFALPRCFGKQSVFRNRLKNRQPVTAARCIVVVTECACCMNYTCAVLGSNIVGTRNVKRFFIRLYKRHHLLILNILKLFALVFGKHLIIVSESLACKLLAYIIYR